jgi:asparagine synthetase B (glutamine-hydrolysing)
LKTLKDILEAGASKHTDKSVAILLSSGVDSQSVLFSLLNVGITPVVYSFTLDNHESKDFKKASYIADLYNLKFVPILLPTDIDTLKTDLKILKGYGAKSKTDFECGWPMLYAYKTITENVIASGLGADGHFCISKKGMIHYKDRIDEFRNNLFTNIRYAQQPIHKLLASEYNKECYFPYLSDEVRMHFIGKSWNQINKPMQKQTVRDTYPDDFLKCKPTLHTNYQKGDSGIDKLFESLIESDWNIGNGNRKWKSVVGIYNAIVSGKI